MNGLNLAASNVLYGPNNSKEFCEAWESLSQHLKRKMGLKNEYEDMGTYVRGQRAKAGVLDQISIDWSDLVELFERSEAPKKANVAIGCPLCNKIWSSKEAYQNFVGDHWEEKIVIAMEDGKPYLYIPIEMDDYYSDTYLQINYCPKCGRKLVEE